jgi:hypothetical protein
MAYGAAPNFPDGTVLTARQLNMLDGGLDHLYGIGKGISVPQKIWSDTDAAGGHDPTLVYRGWVVHRHGETQYLYYDVLVTNNDGSEEVDCEIYYEAVSQGVDTPLVTLHASASRQRGLVSVTDKPTAETHPADGDLVPVKVYAVKSAGDEACTVTVYRLEEIMLPEDYTALNDADALTDDEVTDVAADLQTLSENYVSLDGVSYPDNLGFRSTKVDGLDVGQSGRLHSGTYCTHKTGRLYYRVGLSTWSGGDRGYQTIYVQFRLNGKVAVEKEVSYTGEYRSLHDPKIEEGYIDLTPYLSGASEWNYQQRIRVDVTAIYKGNAPEQGAKGGAVLYYLGEYGTSTDSSWVDFDAYAHGDYVEGDGGDDADNLRSLWTNAMLLADDDGTGYRANQDMAGDGSYPVGYAIACCRNFVQHGGISTYSTDVKGLWGALETEDKTISVQQMAFYRTKDFLYHRTRGAQLVYTGEDGNQATHSLDGYDADNDYQVLDLNEVEGLVPGMWYYIQAEFDNDPESKDQDDEGFPLAIIDFAVERDD